MRSNTASCPGHLIRFRSEHVGQHATTCSHAHSASRLPHNPHGSQHDLHLSAAVPAGFLKSQMPNSLRISSNACPAGMVRPAFRSSNPFASSASICASVILLMSGWQDSGSGSGSGISPDAANLFPALSFVSSSSLIRASFRKIPE